DLVDNQVRNLRKRLLIAAYLDRSGNPATSRKGTYWGIRTDILDYHLPDAMNAECPHAKTLALAEVPTRLASVEEGLPERVIDWGYAVGDAARRKHLDEALQARWGLHITPPAGFPYPDAGV